MSEFIVSDEFVLIMEYDTVVKLVDSCIAARESGDPYPLSSEDYNMLNESVGLSEKRALTTGKTVYEEVYLYLCGRYPTEEEKSVRVSSSSN